MEGYRKAIIKQEEKRISFHLSSPRWDPTCGSPPRFQFFSKSFNESPVNELD